ncbi:MAG: hypothetical protein R3F65_04485 [bacterium]
MAALRMMVSSTSLTMRWRATGWGMQEQGGVGGGGGPRGGVFEDVAGEGDAAGEGAVGGGGELEAGEAAVVGGGEAGLAAVLDAEAGAGEGDGVEDAEHAAGVLRLPSVGEGSPMSASSMTRAARWSAGECRGRRRR